MVTLDPDSEQIVRDRMSAEGTSFERALNDAIRDGAGTHANLQFSTMAVELGEPVVELTHANRVSAHLDDAELVQKLKAGQ